VAVSPGGFGRGECADGRASIITIIAVVVVGLVSASEANACHRFSIWRYPWPQRCMVDYSKFVPLLLAEIKALRARVAKLES